MIQEVLMPKLGQTMEEAKIEAWHKNEGDPVAKGDVLLEIQTDKAVLEVESFVEGTMRKIVAEAGETFPVNSVIALVGEPDDELPDVDAIRAKALSGEAAPAETAQPEAPAAQPEPEKSEPAPQPEPKPEPAPQAAQAPPETPKREGRIFASPRARRRAEEEKAPLSRIEGSGPNGRIVEQDVIDYVEKLKALKVTPVAREIALQQDVDLLSIEGTGTGGKITKEDVLGAAQAAPAKAPAAAPVAAGKPAELTAMRRIVGERMSQSKREAPHFYLTLEADMSAAIALRKSVNDRGRVKVSYHDLLIKACGRALAEQPAMNVFFQDNALVQRKEINIGLAVAIDDGLMVPVIGDVDKLSLSGVAEKSHELIDKARHKRLTPDEYQGGCLTLSNLGMFDIDWFYPIINPGEPAILGVGRIAEKVVAIDGGIHVKPMMSLALCADHRAVDGAIAATFLKRVKELIEAPEGLQ